jgi:hypothetical protein
MQHSLLSLFGAQQPLAFFSGLQQGAPSTGVFAQHVDFCWSLPPGSLARLVPSGRTSM